MKYLLVSVCITAAFGAQAWNVTTDPTIKNALVEEYTGMHCQNCPDGHRIVAALSTLHPENVFTVAIHAGGFSPKPAKRFTIIMALNHIHAASSTAAHMAII